MTESGIYKILNLETGHQYIGSAKNLTRRRWAHWRSLRAGEHYNSHLQRAWDKYGEAAFEFRVVGRCLPERLIELEQEVMDHLKPEYNICGTAGSQFGMKLSLEHRAKISSALKGRPLSPEHRASLKGRIRSPEARANLSVARRGNQNALGYHHSSETRGKISATMKGRPWSAERRAKYDRKRGDHEGAR